MSITRKFLEKFGDGAQPLDNHTAATSSTVSGHRVPPIHSLPAVLPERECSFPSARFKVCHTVSQSPDSLGGIISVSARYWRFQWNSLRHPNASALQLSGVVFYNATGHEISFKDAKLYNENPSAIYPVGHLGYLEAGSSKWVSYTTGPLVIVFPSPITVTAYAFRTGHDDPGRDPCSWTLEACNDITQWSIVSSVDTRQCILPEKRSAMGPKLYISHGSTPRLNGVLSMEFIPVSPRQYQIDKHAPSSVPPATSLPAYHYTGNSLRPSGSTLEVEDKDTLMQKKINEVMEEKWKFVSLAASAERNVVRLEKELRYCKTQLEAEQSTQAEMKFRNASLEEELQTYMALAKEAQTSLSQVKEELHQTRTQLAAMEASESQMRVQMELLAAELQRHQMTPTNTQAPGDIGGAHKEAQEREMMELQRQEEMARLALANQSAQDLTELLGDELWKTRIWLLDAEDSETHFRSEMAHMSAQVQKFKAAADDAQAALRQLQEEHDKAVQPKESADARLKEALQWLEEQSRIAQVTMRQLGERHRMELQEKEAVVQRLKDGLTWFQDQMIQTQAMTTHLRKDRDHVQKELQSLEARETMLRKEVLQLRRQVQESKGMTLRLNGSSDDTDTLVIARSQSLTVLLADLIGEMSASLGLSNSSDFQFIPQEDLARHLTVDFLIFQEENQRHQLAYEYIQGVTQQLYTELMFNRSQLQLLQRKGHHPLLTESGSFGSAPHHVHPGSQTFKGGIVEHPINGQGMGVGSWRHGDAYAHEDEHNAHAHHATATEDGRGQSPKLYHHDDADWEKRAKANRGRFAGLRKVSWSLNMVHTSGPDGSGFGAGRGRQTQRARSPV